MSAGRFIFGARPSAVSSIVARAHAGMLLLRSCESLCLYAGAAGVTLAAAVASGAAPTRPGAWIVAALAGALAALVWWLEHRTTSHEVARSLDRRLGQRGALLVAYELERAGDLGSMGCAVRARVLASFDPRRAVRELLPALFLPAGAPLAGAALFFLALDFDARNAPRSELARIAAGLASDLSASERAIGKAEQDGRIDRETSEHARSVLGDLRALEDELSALAAPLPRASRVEALDRDLAASVRELAAEPGLAKPLDRARAWLHLLAGRPSGGVAQGGAGQAALPAAETDGTMSAPHPAGERESLAPAPEDAPPAAVAEVASPPSTAVETGALGGRWWPVRHDGVVAAWIDARQGVFELERASEQVR